MCHGEGAVERRDVFYGTMTEVCSSCRGHGAIRLLKACSGCDGTGSIVDHVAAASV
jgi:DnaJ-class molecular chaperone